MSKQTGLRFSVTTENESAARAHFATAGYVPLHIERDDNGLVVLVFPKLTGDKLRHLVLTAPAALSAKQGFVVGHRSALTT